MDSAFAWLGKLAEWFGNLVPRWEILDTTQGAVKFVRGHKTKVCHPGIHWYWPATTKWCYYPTARQADRLEVQTMETKDGKTIIVGGMLVYSVHDLMQLLPTTYSASGAVKDLALTAVHDVCCDMEWEELKLEQRRGTLDTKLKNAAQKQLKDYGVTVIKLMLITMARARVLKISQSTSSEDTP